MVKTDYGNFMNFFFKFRANNNKKSLYYSKFVKNAAYIKKKIFML